MVIDFPPVKSAKSMRSRFPEKPNSIPRCTRPCRAKRSPTPAFVSRSTVPCSNTPARTRCSTYSLERLSSTTDSIPSRCSRCASVNPAGPAPTIPTCVRIPAPSDSRTTILPRLARYCISKEEFKRLSPRDGDLLAHTYLHAHRKEYRGILEQL